MKKQIILLAVVVFCCGFAGAETLEPPHISVYGTAEIKVTPNEMVWSVIVTTKDKKLAVVAKDHAATVKKVLGFLKSLKIEEKKLQTSAMQYGEDWKNINRERVKVGYLASTSIGFTISDFDLYQKIWFGLAKIDGVSIQNTQYAHSDRIRYQNESRKQAVLVAREKAVNLAKVLGEQVTEPLKIEEVTQQAIISYSNFASNSISDMSQSTSTSDLALGQISISTKVKIVFKLKNH
jgi:uncharacterized protein YggE